MKAILKDFGVIQNMGWHDRVVRVVIGAMMIFIPIYLMLTGTPVTTWMYVLILVAVYPMLTSIVGFDIFYRMFDVKSCGTSSRNQCGSFPYEIDAALGHNPIPDNDVIHDLEHSHHAK